MTFAPRLGQERTIQAVWEWYEFQSRILGEARQRTLRDLHEGEIPSDSRFFAFTHDELDLFFDEHRRELDYLVMLNLLASSEAVLRLDFIARVKTRQKDPISRRFREIAKRHADRISLEQHILETWKALAPGMRRRVGDFLGALRLRHWLAHGRYWTPKLGRRYSPSDVYDIARAVLAGL